MKAAAVSDLHDPVKADDPQTPDWEADWLDHQIDGVLLVAGNCKDIVHKKLHHIISQFGSSVQRALKIDGNVRPGTQKGKEHFGYQDGISQPIVGDLPNLTKEEMFVPPGQDIIPQGVILCGRPGDAKATSRPSWMLDGSFLCFRKLQQDVSAWENFVVQSSSELGISPDLLGARLVGRWKSGCPINLQPDFDNTEIARDVLRNNFFEFDPTGLNSAQEFTITSGQPSVNCPLGAHIRKTNPRGDQPPDGRASVNIHRILRRGIPYGPEMDEDPAAERGLLFACYQSDLSQGFELIQKRWVSDLSLSPPHSLCVPFPLFSKISSQHLSLPSNHETQANDPSFRFPNSGLDALIGQTNSEPTVGMKGLVPDDANRELHVSGINRFVIPKGGEYFFSPSLSALRGELSDVKV